MPANIGATRSSLESGVMISSSLRGEAWQKSTSPRPSISTEESGGSARIQSSRSWSSTPAAQCVRDDQMSAGSLRAAAGVEAQAGLDELALAVAADRDRTVAERPHGVDRLVRERPARDVAADHDEVDADRVELGQHGRQRIVVAMDVVERARPSRALSRRARGRLRETARVARYR